MKWPWSDPDDPRPVFSRRAQAVGALKNVGAAVFAQMREGDEVIIKLINGRFRAVVPPRWRDENI